MNRAKQPEAETDGSALDELQMIDEEELLKRIPLSRSTLHRLQKRGAFPKGRYVSENRKLYLVSELASWVRGVDMFNPARGRGKGRRPRHRVSPSAT
jgi:predicted DNA-binding transcriptional regulator AlpA